MSMARSLTCFLTIAAGLVLAAICALAVVRHADSGPVYSMAQVRAGLALQPGAWVGRTILVRAEVVPCLAMPSAENGSCTALAPTPADRRRADPAAPMTVDPMPLAASALNPFLASLQRLPFLDGLLRTPQLPPWGTVGIYSIQIPPYLYYPSPPCYEALLLDTAH